MNKVAFGALAMDLKRVAIGYYRGSNVTAERFLREALKRCEEVDRESAKPYLCNLLIKIEALPLEDDDKKKAEDALMYSTLFQNASLAE